MVKLLLLWIFEFCKEVFFLCKLGFWDKKGYFLDLKYLVYYWMEVFYFFNMIMIKWINNVVSIYFISLCKLKIIFKFVDLVMI